MLLRKLLFAIFIVVVSGEYEKCRRIHRKVGCFWESSEGVTLFNNRSKMPWGEEQKNFTTRFACDCNNEALKKGFKYFSLRFYGICVGFNKIYGKRKALKYCPATYGKICNMTTEDNCTYGQPCNMTNEDDCTGDDNFSDMIYETGRDGGFGKWKNSTCTTSCGNGTMVRKRDCNNPHPIAKGDKCSLLGPSEEIIMCLQKPCAVDGGFGQWSDFGKCSVSCGGGLKFRRRKCDNPTPSNGGKDCVGETSEVQECEKKPCRVDGGFGQWSNFGKCSASCGGGLKYRRRMCDNPAPSHGGKDCVGKKSEFQECAQNPCPVDGGFGQWSDFGKCSTSCGGGMKYRRRKCDNPTPRYGGKDCVGEKSTSQECAQNPCPVDGKFGEWSMFTPCTLSCGGGIRRRSRKCNSPRPSNGGKRCIGGRVQVQLCNTLLCPSPVNGKFGEWTQYGDCTASCGGGLKLRHRICNNPQPSNGGKDCDGPTHQARSCGTNPCPKT